MTGRSIVGGNRPEISASRRASSSSRPRLPGGLVSRSRARWASRPGAGSGGLVPREAPGHVAIVGQRGGEKARATARGGSGREEKGLAALAATDAAENQV